MTDYNKFISKIANDLWDMKFDDSHGIRNVFLQTFLCAYYSNTISSIDNWFNKLWEIDSYKNLEEDTKFKIDKLHDNWVKQFDKHPSVYYSKALLIEHNTISERYNKFIIIQERINYYDYNLDTKDPSEQEYKENNVFKYHIRLVYDTTIKQYEDKKWALDYGDIRDEGYVLSTERCIYTGKWKIEQLNHNTDCIEHVGYILDKVNKFYE